MGTVMYSNAGGCYCSVTLLSGSSSSLSTTTRYAPFAPLYGGAGGTSSRDTKGISSVTGSNGAFSGGGGAYATARAANSSYYASVTAGGGGSGYGAGGGGGYAASNDYGTATAKNGGAHGVFDWLDYVLSSSSPASFAITIGAGGAAGKVSGDATYCYYNYGAGASGCVAIYW